MPRRAATQARTPERVAETVAELAGQDQGDAEQAKGETGPLPRRHALAEHQAGEGGHEQRLHADDHRRDPGLDPERDADEHPAEVERVDEETGDRVVAHFRRPPRPGRPRGQGEKGEQRRGQPEAHRQEGERRGVGQAELGADEARAPQDHEQGRDADLPDEGGGPARLCAHRSFLLPAPAGMTTQVGGW